MCENFDFHKKSGSCVLPWALQARPVETCPENKVCRKISFNECESIRDEFMGASTKKHQEGGHLWQGKGWESVVLRGTDFFLCNSIQRGKKNLSLTRYFWNPNFLTAAAIATITDGSYLDEIIFFERDQEFSWSVVCLQDMGFAVPVLSVQNLSRKGLGNKSCFI